jgi:exosome complex component RRP40
LLGKHIPYEVAVGANGRVWVKSGSIKHTILLTNAIKNAEFLDQKSVEQMVKALLEHSSQEQD